MDQEELGAEENEVSVTVKPVQSSRHLKGIILHWLKKVGEGLERLDIKFSEENRLNDAKFYFSADLVNVDNDNHKENQIPVPVMLTKLFNVICKSVFPLVEQTCPYKQNALETLLQNLYSELFAKIKEEIGIIDCLFTLDLYLKNLLDKTRKVIWKSKQTEYIIFVLNLFVTAIMTSTADTSSQINGYADLAEKLDHHRTKLKEALVNLFHILTDLSEISKVDESTEICIFSKQELEAHASLVVQCFGLYNSVINLFTCSFSGSLTSELRNILRYVLKKTAYKIVFVAASHRAKYHWSNEHSINLTEIALQKLSKLTSHNTVSSLLSGKTHEALKESILKEDNPPLFPDGLFAQIMQKVRSKFKQNSWKRDPSLKHALLWCVTQMSYPHLNNHVPLIIPPLLIMADDYQVEHKVLGIRSIHYIIENTNPSHLKLYNHADVIYDTLFKLLYSSESVIFEVLLPCMLKILFVLEPNPSRLKHLHFSKWDKVIQQILATLELESKLNIRRTLVKNFSKYIESIGVNIIKHLRRHIQVFISYLEVSDGNLEESRIYTLVCFKTLLHQSWPVIEEHIYSIIQSIVRLLVDINSRDSIISSNAKEKLEDLCHQILLQLRMCSQKSADNYLNEILAVPVHEDFNNVKCLVRKALESDLETLCIDNITSLV